MDLVQVNSYKGRMVRDLLPRLVVRWLRAPLTLAASLGLILLAAFLAVASPALRSDGNGSSAGLLYEFAFLDTVALGAVALALATPFDRLLDRLSPASRLVLEAGVLALAVWIPLVLVLAGQALFVPSSEAALAVALRSWPHVLSVAATGVLALRLALAPAVRALLLVAAVWILPALLVAGSTSSVADRTIQESAAAPSTLAPILGCLLAAWLCLTRSSAHR